MWNNQGDKGVLNSGCKDDKVMINDFEAAFRLLNGGAVPLHIKYPLF